MNDSELLKRLADDLENAERKRHDNNCVIFKDWKNCRKHPHDLIQQARDRATTIEAETKTNDGTPAS